MPTKNKKKNLLAGVPTGQPEKQTVKKVAKKKIIAKEKPPIPNRTFRLPDEVMAILNKKTENLNRITNGTFSNAKVLAALIRLGDKFSPEKIKENIRENM